MEIHEHYKTVKGFMVDELLAETMKKIPSILGLLSAIYMAGKGGDRSHRLVISSETLEQGGFQAGSTIVYRSATHDGGSFQPAMFCIEVVINSNVVFYVGATSANERAMYRFIEKDGSINLCITEIEMIRRSIASLEAMLRAKQ